MTSIVEIKEMLEDEKVDISETVKLTLEYKGKTYTVDRKFTDKVIEINGYPEMHYKNVSDGIIQLMRKALVVEGKM